MTAKYTATSMKLRNTRLHQKYVVSNAGRQLCYTHKTHWES